MQVHLFCIHSHVDRLMALSTISDLERFVFHLLKLFVFNLHHFDSAFLVFLRMLQHKLQLTIIALENPEHGLITLQSPFTLSSSQR